MCFVLSWFQAVFLFSGRDFIKTESNQNGAVEYNSY